MNDELNYTSKLILSATIIRHKSIKRAKQKNAACPFYFKNLKKLLFGYSQRNDARQDQK